MSPPGAAMAAELSARVRSGLLAALPPEPQRVPRRRAGRPGPAGGGGWTLAAPYRFDDTDLLAVWAEPSRAHLLGGDALGRDVLSRLMVGARISLLVAVSVLVLTLTVGTAAGMAAGYFGGWWTRS